jgi:hypothetical protein
MRLTYNQYENNQVQNTNRASNQTIKQVERVMLINKLKETIQQIKTKSIQQKALISEGYILLFKNNFKKNPKPFFSTEYETLNSPDCNFPRLV